MPSEVADSDRRWVYVLLHGSDDFDTGWNPSWITPAQASRLLACLEAELENKAGYDLFRALENRTRATDA